MTLVRKLEISGHGFTRGRSLTETDGTGLFLGTNRPLSHLDSISRQPISLFPFFFRSIQNGNRTRSENGPLKNLRELGICSHLGTLSWLLIGSRDYDVVSYFCLVCRNLTSWPSDFLCYVFELLFIFSSSETCLNFLC